VVVYFSAYEGFGMPPVEATLAGAAAVFSSLPSMREVMGDCGFPFANDSYDSFATAMHRSLAAPTDQLNEWRDELSRRHNWALVAERIAREMVIVQARE
jgi:glycosyltransferase involved in cell wall biosynthesis